MSSFWNSLTGKSAATTPAPALQEPHDDFSNPPAQSSPDASTLDTPGLQARDPPPVLSGINFGSVYPYANFGTGEVDFFTLEDTALSADHGSRAALPSRGWTDDLCYGTGTTYLTALTIGGAWGMSEGLRRVPVDAPPKLRVNAVLNSITRRGPFLGNSAGVLALMYNLINSWIGYQRGKHDWVNSIVAGGISGAVFRSTRGVRPMAISAGVVAGAAGLWTAGRKLV